LAALVVELDTAGRALRLVLRGQVDILCHDQLRDALAVAIAATGKRPIEVDLSRVTFLDAAGVGVLVVAYNTARSRQLTLRVDGATGIVLQVLEITGAAEVLVGTAGASEAPDGAADATSPVPKWRWLFG
jgi:anti-sigma B factor antagonist